MSSYILFNVRPYQTRMAYVKDKALIDIFYYKEKTPSLVRGIYKGKVSRTVPKLSFAFIDIGLKRGGFLYQKKETGKSYALKTPLKKGDYLFVQIKSDQIRDKGMRLSAEISLSGRYLVYIPNQKTKHAISHRIENEEERERLKKIIENFEEPCSIIARTLAENVSEECLKEDLEKLKKEWEELKHAYEEKENVGELKKALDPKLNYLKDLMNEDIKEVLIDKKQAYNQIKEFFQKNIPDLSSRVKFYSSYDPLFEKFKIESQIKKAHFNKVFLKSGGFLTIEELEAFVVIDVNSGSYMGKGKLEESLLSINAEAAYAIAKQIRLRHLGGIILIDFIDMEQEKDKVKIISILKSELSSDKANPKIFPMTELGLVQITRKRTRASLSHLLSQPCPSCKGFGRKKNLSTIASEIFADLENFKSKILFINRSQKVKVLCHQDIKNWIEEKEKETLSFLNKECSVYPEFIASFKETQMISDFEIEKI